jgi:ribosomal protein S18 acetylase RimI-like enzyme
MPRHGYGVPVRLQCRHIMNPIRRANDVSAEQFFELAQKTWPGSYSLPDVATALARTINIGAWDGDALVGCVRVLTDGYFFATIPEILVLTAYRRQGIGRELMRRAVEAAPRGRVLFGAKPESIGFFERIGCHRSLTGFEMRRSVPGFAPTRRERSSRRAFSSRSAFAPTTCRRTADAS